MSDRALRVMAGLLAGLAALALTLAALSGMVVGLIQDSAARAYGPASAGIIGSANGPTQVVVTGSLQVVVFSVLAAIVALSGMAACVVILRRRGGRKNP